jgi:hypothetical protein
MSASSNQNHLYADLPARVRWFVRRFGAAEMLRKPLRMAFAPVTIRLLPARTFRFKDRTLAYVYHRYNMTWATERCVEIPIARSYLEAAPDAKVLEVGNVLAHYFPIRHDVLDKFESGPRVTNADIVGFASVTRYDLVLSISTFEHIGFDDDAQGSSGEKILQGLANCRRMLADDGLLVITVPTGYNPELDGLIREGRMGSAGAHFLRRTGRREWCPCTEEEALACRYRSPFPYANGLLIAEFRRA